MTLPRLLLQWNGEAFAPASGLWERVCQNHLSAGDTYWIREDFERSSKSHRHYFGTISEGWANLPEHLAQRFPGKDGPECLRKWCLIKAGYHHMTETLFETPGDAQRAAMMAEDRTNPDRYTITVVKGCVVQKYVAETQRQKDMGARRFQESKQDVLELIAGMVGVSVEELAANVKDAA